MFRRRLKPPRARPDNPDMLHATRFSVKFDGEGWALSGNGLVLTRCTYKREAIEVARAVADTERPSVLRVYDRQGELQTVLNYRSTRDSWRSPRRVSPAQ